MSASPASTISPDETPTTTPEPSSTPPASVASFLECDEVDESWDIGGEIYPNGGLPATSQDGALDALLDTSVFVPQDGYERLFESARSVVFVFRSRGLVKVAFLASLDTPDGRDDGLWHAIELRTCDFMEFGVNAALGPDVSVWRNVELDRITIDFVGYAHCDMESARFLWFGRGTATRFVRDPQGNFAERLHGPYLGSTELPPGAVDTGYRRGEDELWRAPGDRAVYVVLRHRVERWPAERDWDSFLCG